MSEALLYIYYIFDALIDWIFNDAVLFSGVSVGWVLVVISVFAMLIRSLLNIPRGARRFDTGRLSRSSNDSSNK